jgi:hypothetical protein
MRFQSQFGISHGFKHFVATGMPDPEGLKASAVARAEMLADVTPNIFMKKVGIGPPWAVSRATFTMIRGFCGVGYLKVTSVESMVGVCPPTGFRLPSSMARCLAGASCGPPSTQPPEAEVQPEVTKIVAPARAAASAAR